LANFNSAVINYTWINKITQLSRLLHTAKMAAMFTLLGEGGGGEKRLRATQVCVTGTNVNKIEVHNPLNPNYKQRFTTWEELFFCF
jgi:hypothetical protein